MLTVKEKNALREEVYGGLETVELATGFEFVGRTKEGALFSDGESFIVAKATVKNDGFDGEAAMAEYAAAQEAKAAKAKKDE